MMLADIPSYRIEHGARLVKVIGAKPWNRLENDLEKFERKPCLRWKRRQNNISTYNAA